MKQGYLSQYFTSIAAKRLSSVEVNRKKSNQHEINGTSVIQDVFGTNDTGEKKRFATHFIWIGEENETVVSDGKLSWYDSRFRNKNRNPEWRLFYPSNSVMEMAVAGDLILIAKRTDETVLSIVVAGGSTVENQILWLFGVPVQTGKKFIRQDIQGDEDRKIDFVSRLVLEEIGIDVEEPDTDHLDFLLRKFKGTFPKTVEFSKYARQTLKGVNAVEEPDNTIMAWMNHEEKLFRRLERQIIDKRLKQGFVDKQDIDVGSFLDFSLSVQQRRKSRAGLALENHLEEIFRMRGLSFTRNSRTEYKSKPDFLFPGTKAYHDRSFPAELLTVLGVKTTCKDRWRQVLSEAIRVQEKHLFTLEPGITEHQTNEMRSHRLQLVVPRPIHETYNPSQRSNLMTLSEFIGMALERQNSAGDKGFNYM